MLNFDTDAVVFITKTFVIFLSFWAVLAFVVQNWNTPETAEMRSVSLNPFRVWLKGDWYLTVANKTEALIHSDIAPEYLVCWVILGIISCWPVGLVNGLLCFLVVLRQKTLTEEINQAIRA